MYVYKGMSHNKYAGMAVLRPLAPLLPHTPPHLPPRQGKRLLSTHTSWGGRRATPAPVPAKASYYVPVRGRDARTLGASRRITTSHAPLSPPHGPRALRRTSGTLLFKETHVPHVTSPTHADCASALCVTKTRRVRRGKRQGGHVGTLLVLLWRGNKQCYDLREQEKHHYPEIWNRSGMQVAYWEVE